MKKERALTLLETGLPIGSVDAYIARVNQIPMLTAEEEREFAEKLQKDGDVTAAKRLILPHLRYVVSVAKTFIGYGLSLADLIQEGNIGLMKAVKRFNPDIGVRLVTFAVHWIKSEMHEFIIRNWRIVKIATTKAQRKLFFKLRSSKQALSWFTPAEVTMVAKDLGVKPAEVVEMEARLYAHDAAFDGGLDEEDEPSFSPSHYLEDHRLSPHTLLEQSRVGNAHTMLTNALRELSPRDQDIIHARWMQEPKATLHDLAAKYNISAERVRQIEKVALQKLKNLVTPLETEIE